MNVEGLLKATLSENPAKLTRQSLLWEDFIRKTMYIAGNPKYREIGLEVYEVDLNSRGGASSDSQSPPT